MKKVSLIISAVLLAAFSLSGCIGGVGGSAGPVATVSPFLDPSLVITQSDAEALVGNALKAALISPTPYPGAAKATAAQPTATGSAVPAAPTPTPAYSNFVMSYYEPAQKGGKFLQVSVLQVTPAMADQSMKGASGISALDQFNTVKGNGPSSVHGDPTMQTVTDILGGHYLPVDAFILPPGLHMYYRGYYVVIGVGDPNDDANVAILKKAGQLAVHNIDKILDGAAS